ncbi:unnamed protein product [Dracunculus medinensis]|uniref:Transmembrane protein n=1 Tax=Dracunculus medinensis TaxID=318479 RepID=A0A158Q468_DRAME|nr:unnamed protein product [Dracunculus medinensis]
MKISELISVSIVIMAAITIVFIGTTKLTAYQGNDLNLDNIIDEVAIHMTNSLFQAQNDVNLVKEIMQEITNYTKFLIEAHPSTTNTSSNYYSSFYLSLAILTTTATKLHFDECEEDTPDISDEYLYYHLKRKRLKKYGTDDNIIFGGNKLEIFSEFSRTVITPIQPASATFLVFLLYHLFSSILLVEILQKEKLISFIFSNFYLITTTMAPEWIYLNFISLWQSIALSLNIFIGCFITTVTYSTFGIAFFEYLGNFTSTSQQKHLEKENYSRIWQNNETK